MLRFCTTNIHKASFPCRHEHHRSLESFVFSNFPQHVLNANQGLSAGFHGDLVDHGGSSGKISLCESSKTAQTKARYSKFE